MEVRSYWIEEGVEVEEGERLYKLCSRQGKIGLYIPVETKMVRK